MNTRVNNLEATQETSILNLEIQMGNLPKPSVKDPKKISLVILKWTQKLSVKSIVKPHL